MLVKTPEFNKRFIGDLSEIIFGSKMYKEILSKEASVGMDYNYFLEKKGLFKNVSFVGSYPGKQYNEIISDIDVVQKVVINNNFTLRLQQIISQLRNPASSFKFIRFYCGLKEHLKIPWVIDDKGNCNFSLENAYVWVDSIRPYVPTHVYNFVYSSIIKPDSLSIKDLIEVEKMMEPYISLSWSEYDIISGYKVDNGVRYDLLDTFRKNKHKNVIKFLYIYTRSGGGRPVEKEYCFVDMSLNRAVINTERLYTYYLNDRYKKFKGLKFHLPENIKHIYRNDMASRIGHLIIIYSNVELINKVQKYNDNNRLISADDMNKLIKKVVEYASSYKFHIDVSQSKLKEAETFLRNIIAHESDILYTKYRKLVTDNYHLKMMLFDEIRAEEASIKINKQILTQRLSNGIKCSFFALEGEDLNKLISISLDHNLDTFKFVKCVVDISIDYKKTPTSVVKLLFSDNNNLKWLSSSQNN